MISYGHDAIDYLRRWVPAVREDTRRLVASPNLDVAITRWAELRHVAERLKAVSTDLNKLINELSDTSIPAQLEAHNLESLHHALWAVKINHSFRVTQKTGRKAEIHAWLQANGYGSLIVPTVNAQTLGAAFKDPYERGEIDPPADLFGVSTRTYASFEGKDEDGTASEA